jgi:hypothetical protein
MNNKAKIWLMVGAIILSAIIFRSTVGVLVSTMVFWALVLGALLILPAFIGAVAGSTVRDVIRWSIRWRHKRDMIRHDKRAA